MKLVIYRNNSRGNAYYTVLNEVEYETGLFKKRMKTIYIKVPHYILSIEDEDEDGCKVFTPRKFSSAAVAREQLDRYIEDRYNPLPEDGVIGTVTIN